jgi:arginyl-tRNA synthetase
MKKTTCRNLRGACDAEITGETPEEMGENSKQHVMKMVQAGDKDHTAAMQEMMMLSKEDQQKWYEDFKNSFDSLPSA